jgi:hypothetical protein
MMLFALLVVLVGLIFAHTTNENSLSALLDVSLLAIVPFIRVSNVWMSTGRVYVSRDVVFDENVFPFASLHPNAGALLKKEILLLPTSSTPTPHGDAQHTDDHMSPILMDINKMAPLKGNIVI